jgi:hypothetical protein
LRLRVVAVAVLAAAVLLVPAAVAATPGTYEGWLYKGNGERWRGTPTTLTVNAAGDRFRLSTYNMRLGCPYLDRNGDQARARFRFVLRGVVSGQFIDDSRAYPRTDPTHEIRVRGRFVGRRFVGRIRVDSAPGITGACTGAARVRATR